MLDRVWKIKNYLTNRFRISSTNFLGLLLGKEICYEKNFNI
jgi:hypothetical protein